MLQEDSNGESSFEIIDRKNQLTSNNEKAESLSTLSSISSACSIPLPSPVTQPSGNLLSNIAPPTSIPDFTLWTSPTQTVLNTQPNVTPVQTEEFPNTQFSAAIPPSKGIPYEAPEQSKIVHSENVTGGLMEFFKGAFSSSGVLSKVAEKAKNSVDSIITTLDPQMSEYIYSGGDTEITVATEIEDEVAAVREAFHSVFGKAWVNGIKLHLPQKARLSIGFEAGSVNAEEKIAYSLKYRNTPTVAIEDILFQTGNNWYSLSLLMIKDAEKGIQLQTFTQGTLVPVDDILNEVNTTKPEWANLTTQEKIATYIKMKLDWQSNISGIPKKEILLLAGKSLIRIYKNQLMSVK